MKINQGPKSYGRDVALTFKKCCLFCLGVRSCILPREYDPKTPLDRRISAYEVGTVLKLEKEICNSDLERHGKKYKDYVLEICDLRNDNLVRQGTICIKMFF